MIHPEQCQAFGKTLPQANSKGTNTVAFHPVWPKPVARLLGQTVAINSIRRSLPLGGSLRLNLLLLCGSSLRKIRGHNRPHFLRSPLVFKYFSGLACDFLRRGHLLILCVELYSGLLRLTSLPPYSKKNARDRYPHFNGSAEAGTPAKFVTSLSESA